MTDILVSGDTGPAITATIHEYGNTSAYENLTGSTVRFQMRRKRDRRLMVDREADIIEAASGMVSYTPSANDTAIPGDYVVEWQVTYPDGKKQTTVDLKDITIRRR